ncbi:MAG: PepSY-associated TM helix domain-containing protein [Nannocystaceae bacterium]
MSDAKPTPASKPRRRFRWRPWLRAFHRDIGYVAVGLTFVYALSGLAVNHIGDWDPNFDNFEKTHSLALELPQGEQEVAKTVLAELAIAEDPVEVYASDVDETSVLLENRQLLIRTVSPGEVRVIESGQNPRLMLRVSNWLHLNRGKKAWTYIADGYAVFLLFLATSGVFMLPGKKGLRGRGWIFVALGVAIPVGYVTLSGGP